MNSIKYSLCANGHNYGSGTTQLKDALNRPLESNGCTLLLCTSGRALASVNLQKRVFRKGSLVFLFYDTVFVPLQTSESFSALYISLPMKFIEEALYKMTSISFWDFVYAYPICPVLPKQYLLIYSWFQQVIWILEECVADHRFSLLNSFVHNLFMATDSEIRKNASHLNQLAKKDRAWTLYGKFASLLSKNVHTHRDVKFYADSLCISPDYLYKITYKTMNLSPKELINQQVLMEIKTYLSCTDLSIKHIATEFKFEDPSYLCRFFRKYTRLSPLDFRNNLFKIEKK